MDKNAIKKYAVWARRELISRVTQKALQYGITEKEMQPANASSVNGVVLSAKEKKQRQALIAKISAEGFEQVMEEVAYTWFNRFSALRFMEVNGYLPTHVRVFTDEENNFKPQILAEAINLEIEGLDMEKVYALKEANDNDALFKYLIITQCNALSAILPGMFQKIDDYTELLFPDNLLREGSAIEQMIAMIPETDWQDAVQIIGWLYQYYIAEPKDELINARKQYKDADIPFVTQLFTSDWIVRYMVENSLGRLWLKGHPNEKLKSEWQYYLEEAEQESGMQAQLAKIRKEYEALTPEDIRCIDPCSGSGHILAYLFDVLVQIYENYGYTAREAAASIVDNNLYGLDIDTRATQLSYFVVMMKERHYDRRFFSRGIQPHVYTIVESNNIDRYAVEYFLNGNEQLEQSINTIIDEMHDARDYGSILNVSENNWNEMYVRFAEIQDDISIHRETVLRELLPLVRVAQTLAIKYKIVVTNPPYMNSAYMPPKLKNYVQRNYADFKNDMFSVFVKTVLEMTTDGGQVGLLMPYVWMFISSYEKMRTWLNANANITTLVQLEYNAFEAACVPVAALTIEKNRIHTIGEYIKLSDFKGADNQAPKTIEAVANKNCGYRYSASQNDFSKIPGSPIAYWVSTDLFNVYDHKPLGDFADPKKGLDTAANDLFLRFWHEVDASCIGFGFKDGKDFVESGLKWAPLTKGGQYRKWYGNNEYVLNWQNNGAEVKSCKMSNIRNEQFYFHECLTWTDLSNYKPSFRYNTCGFIHNVAGPCVFSLGSRAYYIAGLLNSKPVEKIMEITSPTMHFNVGAIADIPYIISEQKVAMVSEMVESNIKISKADWDSFESSWDFTVHPLVPTPRDWEEQRNHQFEDMRVKKFMQLEWHYGRWANECDFRFDQLKSNEEELNRIFIDIYGLQNELTPEVEDKDVTVRKANLQRDIKSLISYAVGCMFGRYSLDVEGLVFAGGNWDAAKYTSFPADKDNIIPICNDGDYFEDDIVGRFVKFIEAVYGKESLKENLQFIADALGGKGQPKNVIRNYFLNEFFNDHCKMYQKRPIYWQFDSGKKNGFKCLIYMHRYQPDTIARIRTDYVHEQQGRYRTAIADLENRMEGASTSDRVKLSKQLTTLQAQAAEIHDYEEKIHHLADQYISIDLDDGVKVNYAKFQDVLAKIK